METTEITVRQMIESYFGGNRIEAAKAAGITVDFLNNMVSTNRKVLRLENGGFVLVTKTQKVFKWGR